MRTRGQGGRALCALCIVLLLIALVPAAGTLAGWIGSTGTAMRTVSLIATQEEDFDYRDIVMKGESVSSSIPSSFQDELLFVEGFQSVNCSREYGLVGFVVDERPSGAFEQISKQLEASGWRAVESGHPSRGTFTKQSGSYRWVYVSCVASGDKTSVVIQCMEFVEESP